MADSVYSDMLQSYFVPRLRQHALSRQERFDQIKTRAAAQQYCRRVRTLMHRIFSPWPVRTPLNAQVTGVVQRKNYRIEKVLFQSRPGYYVTANLYVPRGSGPFPVVVAPCGHSEDGKAAAFYQEFNRSLASQGFMTLIYDPVSQGERLQYRHLKGPWQPTVCTREHNMAGKQLALVGEFFGAWRAWDGIRALDYLLARREADKTRVGVTGNSGGGTLSSYLTALDPRFTMAAPSCFLTTYRHNLENELPADSEQIPPGILAAGLDHADFLLAYAPRPVLLVGQARDAFDTRGIQETFAQVRHIYRLLGAEKNVELFIGQNPHGYYEDGRRAMYRFFHRHANVPGRDREVGGAPEKLETLRVTPTGQVAKLPGNRFVFQFAAQAAKALAKERGNVSGPRLQRAITQVLALPRRQDAPYYRTVRITQPQKDLWCMPFRVETEPGITALLELWQKTGKDGLYYRAHPQALPNAILHIPHLSAREEVQQGLLPVPLTRVPEQWTLEYRGIGASRPLTCNDTDFFAAYGADYFYDAYHLMFGESYLGRRVHDVLSTLDLLQSVGTKRVHLSGRGMGGIVAALAACLHPVVKQVTLRNVPRSFHEFTQTPLIGWPQSILPWGALRSFDLPDCYRMLKTKKLKVSDWWSASMGQTGRTRKPQ